MDQKDRLMLAQVDVSIRALEKTMAKAGIEIDKGTDRMQKRWERMNRRMSASSAGMARDVRQGVAGIALGLAAREVTSYADAWTEAGNKISAAGVALEQRNAQLGKLADLAIETRSSFEATSMLRARLGIATEDLVGKEYDLLKVTELVNKATVAGGSGDQERRSTILQLSQALASGELMGEELRALRENAPILLRAIAKEFEVPIGSLKKLGAEGKLTSERILDAILNAEGEIQARFSKTDMTIGDSLTNLQTRATQYIGMADDSLQASEKIAGAIMYIAENVDVFAEALVVAGAALTGAFGASAAISVVKGLADITRGTQGAASAMALLRAASSFVFGPAGIILGVAAAAAAFAYFAIKGDNAADAVGNVETALRRYEATAARIKSDTERLAELNDQLREAIANQQPVIEATARADIAAISSRIAKNRELQQVLAVTARAELARAKTEQSRLVAPRLFRPGLAEDRHAAPERGATVGPQP